MTVVSGGELKIHFLAATLTKQIRDTHHQSFNPRHLQRRLLQFELKVHHELRLVSTTNTRMGQKADQPRQETNLHPSLLIPLQTLHNPSRILPRNTILPQNIINLLFLFPRRLSHLPPLPLLFHLIMLPIRLCSQERSKTHGN